MQINITGHHLDITDSIRSSVHSKLEKLQQQFPDVSSLQVILTLEKHSQIAEVITHYLGQDVTAKAKADDLYQAINDVTAKIIGLLKKQKEKVKAHPNQKPQRAEETITDADDDDDEIND
ncbi:MAG: ribosome-associated translation inhibitor RaiA [Spongiibacteraceae bacterium]